MSAKQNPGGVAGRVITELTEQPGGQDIERTMTLRSIRNALLKMHHELSREARAILAEWEDPAVEAQRSLLEQTFTDLGLNLTEEESHE